MQVPVAKRDYRVALALAPRNMTCNGVDGVWNVALYFGGLRYAGFGNGGDKEVAVCDCPAGIIDD